MFDAIIIGAGPAGLTCAKNLKRKGLSVGIIEEHEEIGLPVQCSGLISWNLQDFTEIDQSYIENIINEAHVHSPSGRVLELKKSRPVYVLDRHLFDRSLSEGLEDDLILGTKAISIDFDDNSVSVNTDKGKFRGKILIGADGPDSMVARHFNVKPKTSIGLIAMTKKAPKTDFAKLYYDRKITEGFLWKIPRGNCIEYGMMGKNAKTDELKSFFGLHNEKVTFSGGLIPVKPAQKTYFSRCILLGDAAGQVKPWSGGGVIYGMKCALIASGIIEKCFQKNDFSSETLAEYEKEWKKAIGKQITLGRIWNSFVDRSNNHILEAFFLGARIIPWNRLDMDFIRQAARG